MLVVYDITLLICLDYVALAVSKSTKEYDYFNILWWLTYIYNGRNCAIINVENDTLDEIKLTIMSQS